MSESSSSKRRKVFFLHTFNLVAQSPRASWFFPPSVLFIAAFSSLAGKYGCSKTSIQESKKNIYFSTARQG